MPNTRRTRRLVATVKRFKGLGSFGRRRVRTLASGQHDASRVRCCPGYQVDVPHGPAGHLPHPYVKRAP